MRLEVARVHEIPQIPGIAKPKASSYLGDKNLTRGRRLQILYRFFFFSVHEDRNDIVVYIIYPVDAILSFQAFISFLCKFQGNRCNLYKGCLLLDEAPRSRATGARNKRSRAN